LSTIKKDYLISNPHDVFIKKVKKKNR